MLPKLITKAIGSNISRLVNKPLVHPFNLTISVTGKCNSKCRTCKIWQKQKVSDLSLHQWKKILTSVGSSPIWITISGGEPFIRPDITEIIKIIAKKNKPKIITIATNGILSEKIYQDVKQILSFYHGKLIINISVDGVGGKHDEIRGVKCHDKVKKTIRLLKSTRATVGIHTVISRYNVNDLKDIRTFVQKLKIDSYICQIAENREELENMGDSLLPPLPEYFKAVRYIQSKDTKANGVSRITKVLRNGYYKLSRKSLIEKKASIPCYAGIASAHINYNGDLWACCVKTEKMGNLLEQSFGAAWTGKRARAIRKRIKDEKCFCTMANACYSNIICDPICVFS